MGYRKLQRVTGVKGGYKGLQEVTGVRGGYRGYKGLQRVKGGYKGLQGVTGGYKRLQGVTDSYRLLEMVTGGVTIGYRMVNNYNIKLFTCATHAQQKLMVGRSLATTLEAIWCSLSACKFF